MQLVRTEVTQGPMIDGRPTLRVMFRGEGGESVTVDMANAELSPENHSAAVERAKALLVQTATFDLAANEYDAQSNGNFDEVAASTVSDSHGRMYVFEYRDGDGARRVPPSLMPSVTAAREEALRCAVEILQDLDPARYAMPSWLVRVYDEHGSLVWTIDAQEANAVRRRNDADQSG